MTLEENIARAVAVAIRNDDKINDLWKTFDERRRKKITRNILESVEAELAYWGKPTPGFPVGTGNAPEAAS